MVSDDTEHTWMVGQALCEHPTDPEAFARTFARRLRWWLLGVPAGIGLATLRATVRLWLGYSPASSGVFSAGNGPAMRSAVLGAAIDDIPTLQRFVLASTRVTHTDPKAYEGAFAVALAAWCARRGIVDAAGFFAQHRAVSGAALSPEFSALLERVELGLASGIRSRSSPRSLGASVGYRDMSTARCRSRCSPGWPGDHRSVVSEVVRCGGDTDTTAAIAGAIAGSGLGPGGVPREWIDGLWEWPRSLAWTRRLAAAVGEATVTGVAVRPPRVIQVLALVRNAIFLVVVLLHAFRRLLPPY